MTSTLATSSGTAVRTAVIGAATAAVAATFTTLFAHDWREVFIVAPAIVVVAAFVYGVVVPRGLRRESAGGTALTLAVIGALTAVPAFWSGMPLVLGVAAMMLGAHGRNARKGAGTSIAGLVLGALGSLFYLWIYVSEGLAGQAGLPG